MLWMRYQDFIITNKKYKMLVLEELLELWRHLIGKDMRKKE